jgi:hypothetical protein
MHVNLEVDMAKTLRTPRSETKRGRGRPRTTGTGRQVQLRCHADFLKRVDAWRAKQEGDVSRPDAIRRLAELGLTGSRSAQPRSQKARSRARELAGKQLNQLSDPAASAEERQQRRRL